MFDLVNHIYLLFIMFGVVLENSQDAREASNNNHIDYMINNNSGNINSS